MTKTDMVVNKMVNAQTQREFDEAVDEYFGSGCNLSDNQLTVEEAKYRGWCNVCQSKCKRSV